MVMTAPFPYRVSWAGACGRHPPSVQPLTNTLIPTYLSHVKRRFIRGHGARARHLSLPAFATRGARRGAPVRRGAAAARPHQRPVLADDVAQPAGAADHG